MHINGASIFFLFIYLHLFRGIFYFRATQRKVWLTGNLILLLIMAISFLGYVLPWGQISYWAVAVITNLFSIAPIVGDQLVQWIWGGFSVNSPTLNRFYSLHFLLPFLLSAIVMVHLFFLHQAGSTNPTGLKRDTDKAPFHPYFTFKDTLFIVSSIWIINFLIFNYPYLLGDPVNNVPANPIQTPVHIQPEWYFLTSYAILRALPNKTAGVLALVLSVTIFMILPIFNYKIAPIFRWMRQVRFWTMVICFLILIAIGSLPAEEPFTEIRKFISFIYFTLILTINL